MENISEILYFYGLQQVTRYTKQGLRIVIGYRLKTYASPGESIHLQYSGFECHETNQIKNRMIGSILQWVINTWLYITGRSVSFEKYPWLRGPYSDNNDIGQAFYRRFSIREQVANGSFKRVRPVTQFLHTPRQK
jgi:hypothetical protein